MAESSATLVGNYNFRVTLRQSAGAGGAAGDALGEGGFQECTGLEIEMDVQTLEEGGRNFGVVRRVGRARFQNLVLKRGMFVSDGTANADLWRWLQGVLEGRRPVVRYDGTIEVLDPRGNADEQRATVLARWTFERGLPAKVVGPTLNAKTGDLAMEELHIAHEGLRFETEAP